MSDEYGFAAKEYGGYAMPPGACFPLSPVPSTRHCSGASMRVMSANPISSMTVFSYPERCAGSPTRHFLKVEGGCMSRVYPKGATFS